MRRAIATATVALAALQVGASAVACEIRMPPNWESKRARWIGSCHNGFAEGLGVVAYEGGKQNVTFYGRFTNGRFLRGALEEPARGIASLKTENDVVVYEYDRSDRVESIRTGADAASKVSKQLAKEGRAKEAEAYEAKARQMLDMVFKFNVP